MKIAVRKLPLAVVGALVIVAGFFLLRPVRLAQARHASSAAPAAQAASAEELDRLLAPVALYPDQLLAQIFLCAMDPAGVTSLDRFLKAHPTLKGTDLQDAVLKDNFEPSFVALSLFPQTVTMMVSDINWTTRLGQAFASDRTSVFGSVQRLRKKAKDAGNLKSTPQQDVEMQTTSGGEQVIVIEPANPQVVYVPQYNTQTVYVQQPASTTVVVQESSSSADAAVAGMIGFTAGIAIGAAVNNNYYYGPYGWHGGGYMYNDAWDDYYDHREDAREDWMDHREDMVENRSDRANEAREQRTERTESRQENRPESQQQRTERQQTRQQNGAQSQSQRSTQAQTASTGTRGSGSYESRGQSERQTR
ncbi:MAG TPA: DUF3300 domain-containing protein, partial [Vicinamibacterales bacterium]